MDDHPFSARLVGTLAFHRPLRTPLQLCSRMHDLSRLMQSRCGRDENRIGQWLAAALRGAGIGGV